GIRRHAHRQRNRNAHQRGYRLHDISSAIVCVVHSSMAGRAPLVAGRESVLQQQPQVNEVAGCLQIVMTWQCDLWLDASARTRQPTAATETVASMRISQ